MSSPLCSGSPGMPGGKRPAGEGTLAAARAAVCPPRALTLVACAVSSIPGATGLSPRCLQGKRQKALEQEAQRTVPPAHSWPHTPGTPHPSCRSPAARSGDGPRPHPSRGCCGAPLGAAVPGWTQRHGGFLHHARRVPRTPQRGSLLTLAGSRSRTGAGGVSSVTWVAGGWGTTRSIQPSIPPPAGREEASPAGGRPAAHAPRGAAGVPAAHAVPGAA